MFRKLIMFMLPFCIMTGIASAEMLTNRGFETGDTTGWTENVAGGTLTVVSSQARTGTYSLEIDSTGAGAWASPNVFQGFAASPGQEFNMQGYMLRPASYEPTDISFGLFKIEFLDVASVILEPASISIGTGAAAPYYGVESVPHCDIGSAADTWIFSEAQGVAPAGTVLVNLYALNVNQALTPGAFYYDDISATPEPATIALLGLGGLFLRRRK